MMVVINRNRRLGILIVVVILIMIMMMIDGDRMNLVVGGILAGMIDPKMSRGETPRKHQKYCQNSMDGMHPRRLRAMR